MIDYNYVFLLENKLNRVGIWHRARIENILKQSKQLMNIATLPYLRGYKLAPKIQGVTIYKNKFAYNRLNLYTSGHASKALLMDMKALLSQR